MEKLAVFGATSAIAQATARHFAADGARFFLVGRNEEKLRHVADDLTVRGARLAETRTADLTQLNRHDELVRAADAALGGLDAALIAHGSLSDQKACERDVECLLREFATNALSFLSLLTLLANYFEARRAGTLAAITSVAGDRGRESNYVYGAAKAAVSTFLGGLRLRLRKAGVQVVTIKPGFVDTPMTAAYPKNLLFASADRVGRGIYRAMRRGRGVVYLPWFWRPLMRVIRELPEPLFRRLPL